MYTVHKILRLILIHKVILSSASFDVKIDRNIQTLFLYPSDETEVRNAILKLKKKSSFGWDEIPSSIVKLCVTGITKPLNYILNLTLETGVFPDALKTAVVIPVFKKGDTYDLTNYRPISLLPSFSKVFEIIIYNRITNFIHQYSLLSEEQHGFIRGRNIDQALFKTFLEVLETLNRGDFSAIALLDLSKAFDSMDINLLIYKLEFYGIRGTASTLIKSYLTNRRQCVKITSHVQNFKEDVLSPYAETKKGVPQGSILGPLLFIMYINELPKMISRKLVCFADDTAVLFSSRNHQVFVENLKETLASLNKWFDQNTLRLNVEKTQIICFRSELQEISLQANQVLTVTKSAKYLGIFIDNSFSSKTHVEYLSGKLSRMVYLFYQLREAVSMQVMLQVYHAYVSSVLRYGVVFWGGSPNIDEILKVQKKCVRVITHSSLREHAKPLFRKLRILTVIDMYILESAYLVLTNPALFEEHRFQHGYSTRNQDQLVLMQTRKGYIDGGPLNMCIRIFNKIPKKFKSLNRNKFKKELGEYLLTQNLYSMDEFVG